jgi:uncharacterized protein
VRVTVRFYAELNDFLDRRDRFAALSRLLPTPASAKDVVESFGVPHTEVDLLLANGESVAFDYRVSDGDRLAVYPVFEAFDVTAVTRVRPEPLRHVRFVLDVHLGRLARHLRLAGFDSRYVNDADDATLALASTEEGRILLTRDQGLLKRRAVSHGYCVRETAPLRQFAEVLRRFDLRAGMRPFTRCTCCNGELVAVDKASVEDAVPPRSWARFETFLRCAGCRRVYWRGSHVVRLEAVLARALD